MAPLAAKDFASVRLEDGHRLLGSRRPELESPVSAGREQLALHRLVEANIIGRIGCLPLTDCRNAVLVYVQQ